MTMTDNQTTGYPRSARAVAIAIALGFFFCGASTFAGARILQPLGEAVERVGEAVERALPDHPSVPTVLSPGAVLAFGNKQYAIFGADSCPPDPMDTSGRRDFECLKMTPGMVKSVVLVPVGSKAALHARVAISRTGQATIVELTSLLYPDGRAQSIMPPLVGRDG